jgi:hypothetical protein
VRLPCVKDAHQYFPECIKAFMARAFRGTLTVHTDRRGVSPNGRDTLSSMGKISEACNRYYLTRLKQQAVMPEGLQAGRWLKEVAAHVFTAIAEKRGFLLRVGKHAGGDYLTIEQFRELRTKYKTPLPLSITLCSDGREQVPFGWVFVEICPTGVTPPPFGLLDTLRERAAENLNIQAALVRAKRLSDAQAAWVAKRARSRQLVTQEADRLAADEAQQMAREQHLASLSDIGRRLEELAERMRATTIKQKFGAELYGRLQPMLVGAQAQDSTWEKGDLLLLGRLILDLALAKIDFPDKKSKELKRLALNWTNS